MMVTGDEVSETLMLTEERLKEVEAKLDAAEALLRDGEKCCREVRAGHELTEWRVRVRNYFLGVGS